MAGPCFNTGPRMGGRIGLDNQELFESRKNESIAHSFQLLNFKNLSCGLAFEMVCVFGEGVGGGREDSKDGD